MKITLTNEKKSIDIEIKETAVVIEMRAVGDTMVFHVEEQPMMVIEQPKEEPCEWVRVVMENRSYLFSSEEHKGVDLRVFDVNIMQNCPVCGKKIKVIN